MKLKKNIYIFSAAICSTLVFIAFILLIEYNTRRFESEFKSLAASRADMASAYMGNYLSSYIDNLTGMGEMDVTSRAIKGDPSAAAEIVNIISLSDLAGDYVEGVMVISADKKVIAAASGDPESVDLNEDIIECLNAAKLGPVVTDAESIALNSKKYFYVCSPIFENRRLLGYIISKVNFKVFSRIQGNMLLNGENDFLLFDGENNLVHISSGSKTNYGYELLSEAVGSTIDDGKYFVGESDILVEGTNTGWKVFYLLTGKNMYGVFRQFTFAVTLVYIFALCLSLVLYRRYEKRVIRPLKQMAAALEDLSSARDYTPITLKTGDSQFDIIINSLNKIISENINGNAAIMHLSKKYHDLFKEKKLVFVKWDLTTYKFSVSPYYYEIFGRNFLPYEAPTFLPDDIGIHPDDAAKFNDWLRDVKLGRKTPPTTFRKKMPDGKYRYFEYTFITRTDEVGTPLSVLGLITDADRYVRKEIALKRAAELDRYTGIYNKYTYIEKLRARYEKAVAGGENICIGLLKLHNFYDLEDIRPELGEEALKFISNVVSENIECFMGRILTDAIGFVCVSKNTEFLFGEIMKELDLGFECSEGKRCTVNTAAVIFSTENLSEDFEGLISKCVDEYEGFKDEKGNTFYFAEDGYADDDDEQ